MTEELLAKEFALIHLVVMEFVLIHLVVLRH